MSYNKFPWTNMHGFNLDWVIQTVEDCKQKVDGIVEEVNGIFEKYVTKTDLTSNRKLSESGDFTGTWFSKTYSYVFGKVDSNTDQIEYLSNQFADGRTGLVIDGGFFEETGIDKNYDGGVF